MRRVTAIVLIVMTSVVLVTSALAESAFLAQPSRPDHIGKNYLEWKTSDGKYPQKMSIEVAKTKGEGWVEYVQAKPEELKKPPAERILSKKSTYIYRVPGKEMYCGAGIYE